MPSSPNYERWDQCFDRFGRDYAINAPWEEMTVANHAFSFLYLNPPYDWEAVSRENEDGNEGTSSGRTASNTTSCVRPCRSCSRTAS